MVPCVPDVLRYGLKTLYGVERMHALPALRCRDAALRRLVGCNAPPVRQGGCQRGAATRQGPRTAGPIGPDTWAENLVKLNRRDLEALSNGVIRALATTGACAAKVTGMVDATDLETTAPYEGGGQVTRRRRITDKRGHVQAIEVTVDGWKLIVVIDASAKRPLAGQVGPIHAPEVLSLRALVTQARTHLAGSARLHKVVFEQGLGDGPALWWRDQHGIRLVVPAKDNLAVTVDAQAHAAAGAGVTVGRRVHTVRQGQGKPAGTARLETEVVGLAGLTTDAQYGTPEHGRYANRRDVQPNPSTAVVVRQWHNRDYGPGGKTVFLTNAAVDQPWRPFDDDDDRRLIAHGWMKEHKPPWSVKHPPQKTARAVRVHVLFPVLMFALATAYRRQGAQGEAGAEPIGWQRGRRQRLEQTRDRVIILAEASYGSFHLAEYSLVLGVKLKDVPPGIGPRPQILAKSGLAAPG
jgi:hypothetical protein